MTPPPLVHLYNRTHHPISLEALTNQAMATLQELSFTAIVEVDVTISGNRYIKSLNRRYRQIDCPTDVLSFPTTTFHRGHLRDGNIPATPQLPIRLGDIVIACPIAARQAKEHGHTTNQEILLLFAHGLKHLLGYHHK